MKLRIFIIFILLLTTLYYSHPQTLNFFGETHRSIALSDESNETGIPRYLYLIVSKEVWNESLQMDALILPHDQFIHLAKEDQINHIAEKFWNEMDYVILKIETKRMIGRLVYETNPGGLNKYFHLYNGSIPLDSIVKASQIESRN